MDATVTVTFPNHKNHCNRKFKSILLKKGIFKEIFSLYSKLINLFSNKKHPLFKIKISYPIKKLEFIFIKTNFIWQKVLTDRLLHYIHMYVIIA